MSAPTKIYLALVAALATLWAVQALVLGSGDLIYRSDAHYTLQNAHRLPAILRGRVVLRDASGADLDVPADTLQVAVRARDHDGTLAVRRVGAVDPSGVFEVASLPEGEATVSLQLGGGSVVWQVDGVALGTGLIDERLDPIALEDLLFPIRVEVVDPEGERGTSGHLVWRCQGDGTSDDLSFEGDAPIRDGVATFLATAPSVDVVTLVPGASCELFEGLWGDEEIHLAPGVTAAIRPTGQVPSDDDWTLRVALTPVRPEPAIEYDPDSLSHHGALVAAVQGGAAELPLARGGRYRVSWWALPTEGHRFQTLRVAAPNAAIEVPAGAGRHTIDVPFPMEEFARRASARR
ncbi:MAG: hypothetical protein AAF957_02155 [Planctomycetota bacterium]